MKKDHSCTPMGMGKDFDFLTFSYCTSLALFNISLEHQIVGSGVEKWKLLNLLHFRTFMY